MHDKASEKNQFDGRVFCYSCGWEGTVDQLVDNDYFSDKDILSNSSLTGRSCSCPKCGGIEIQCCLDYEDDSWTWKPDFQSLQESKPINHGHEAAVKKQSVEMLDLPF